MTLKELDKLRSLDTLIQVTRNRILALEESLDVAPASLDGMPHGPGASDKIGNILPVAIDEKAKLSQMFWEYMAEKSRIIEYIDGIENYNIRLIFTLRFLENKTWGEVAGMIGGGNTEESVKKACYRFLNVSDWECTG